MPPYEFDPNAPIYLQIIGEIKKRSVRGVYSPGVQSCLRCEIWREKWA